MIWRFDTDDNTTEGRQFQTGHITIKGCAGTDVGYAGLPHDWCRNNPIARYEGHYASVFYSHFAALGLGVTVEDASHHGKVDMSVDFGGHIYLFEFKVVEQLPEGTAPAQIKHKGYAD
ncbi:PD-(D/E)XK nuclease domain-containing protein [Halomonas sp. AOP13-D3-9]